MDLTARTDLGIMPHTFSRNPRVRCTCSSCIGLPPPRSARASLPGSLSVGQSPSNALAGAEGGDGNGGGRNGCSNSVGVAGGGAESGAVATGLLDMQEGQGVGMELWEGWGGEASAGQRGEGVGLVQVEEVEQEAEDLLEDISDGEVEVSKVPKIE